MTTRINGALITTQRSRHDRNCDAKIGAGCWGILKGHLYAKASLPPRVEPNSGPHWETRAVCTWCAWAYLGVEVGQL